MNFPDLCSHFGEAAMHFHYISCVKVKILSYTS